MLGLLIIGIVIYLLYSVSGSPAQNTTIDNSPISAKIYDIANGAAVDNGGGSNSIVNTPVVSAPVSVQSSPAVTPAVSSTPVQSVDSVSQVTKVKFLPQIMNAGDYVNSNGEIVRV